MPEIPYHSSRFPLTLGPRFQGRQNLPVSWDDIVWAAITVGKASPLFLLRHGNFSEYEILYRIFMIYANLRERANGRVCRSIAYDALDPSEKGAISYFIGLAMAKLFAGSLLDVGWLMHLDVYQALVRPTFRRNTRSRPDLVGQNTLGQWIVMEGKGRTNLITQVLMRSAKRQTRQIRRISGQIPFLRIAFASYFNQNVLSVEWHDPPDGEDEFPQKKQKPFYHHISENGFFRNYYKPFRTLLKGNLEAKIVEHDNINFLVTNLEVADVAIGLDTRIIESFEKDDFRSIVREIAQTRIELHDSRRSNIFNDGLFVKTGERWASERMKEEPFDREGLFDFGIEQ